CKPCKHGLCGERALILTVLGKPPVDAVHFLAPAQEGIGNLVDRFRTDARVLEGGSNRPIGESCMLLLTAEALLCRREEDVAVLDQGGGRVLVQRGDSEDSHLRAALGRQPKEASPDL